MSLFTKLFGDTTTALLKSAKPLVKKINSLEEEIKALPDAAFPQKTADLKARLEKGESLDDILPEAFALVREGSAHRRHCAS